MLANIHGRIRAWGVFCMVVSVALTGWAAAESICPAPRATCSHPAAARLSEQAPAFFHAAQVDTHAVSSEPECAEPRATCVQPRARVAQLADHGLGWASGSHLKGSVESQLAAWAMAAQGRPEWTPTEKNWLARRHQPWLSAVALENVVRLASAVKEAELSRDFTWTVDTTDGSMTRLHAVPTDETQRLFCPQMRVELDSITHALTAIDIADRTGTWRPIDLPWAVFPKPTRGEQAMILTADNLEFALTGVVSASEIVALPPLPASAAATRFAIDRAEFDATTPR